MAEEESPGRWAQAEICREQEGRDYVKVVLDRVQREA